MNILLIAFVGSLQFNLATYDSFEDCKQHIPEVLETNDNVTHVGCYFKTDNENDAFGWWV